MASDQPPVEAWAGILGSALVEPMPYGQVWRVTAEDGRAYVLKRHPTERPADLVSEYRVLVHLQAHSVPVAPPIVTDAGALSAGSPDTWTLSTSLPVSDVTPDVDFFRTIGGAIGHLHRALETFPYPVSSYDLELAPRTFELIYPKLPWRGADSIIDSVTPLLEGLPAQLIHGDLHGGNVLVHNGKVSGFVDVDHLPTGARMYDIAYYLTHQVRWAVLDAAEAERRSELLHAAIRPYIDSYHAVNPLTEKEIEATVAVMLASQILLTEWNQANDQREWYEHGLRALDWIVDNYDRLQGHLVE